MKRPNQKNLCFLIFNALIILGCVSELKSQDSTKIDLDRIFTKKEFTTLPTGIAPWFNEEKGYLKIEKSLSFIEARQIVCINPASGEKSVIVPAEKLIPEGKDKPIYITDYAFSTDQKKVLINSKINNGNKNKRDDEYWLLNLSGWKLLKINLDDLNENPISIELSPDAQKIAFVYKSNIYVQENETSKRIQLTFDGSSKIMNGNSAYQFYRGINITGFLWSPDSKHIAYIQLNAEKVKEFIIINNTKSLYPEIDSVQYVMPGEQLPACRIGMLTITGGEAKRLNIPGDPSNNYITNFEWAGNSTELMIQQLNRNQNLMKVYLINNLNSEINNIWTDSDDAFLDPVDLIWIDQGKNFLWLSEKDGWRHIYKISRDGKKSILITPGKFDVDNIRRIDEKKGWIYFMASPDNAIYRFLYRVKIDGTGMLERVTPNGVPGNHNYSLSPESNSAFHTYSNMSTPPVTELISLPDHKVIKVVENNSALKKKLEIIKRSPIEFLKVDIGNGTVLDAWCIKPPDFDSTKKYPVIFHVYSMPAAQAVRDQWGAGEPYLWYLMMAEKGFIIMNVDTRGTPSLYGREWRKVIYKKHGLLPSDEQAAALKSLTAKRPYMDGGKIGIFGWSGGGMISLMQILRYPELYNTAIAGAYLSSSRFFNAGFTERYLGLPQDNPDAYNETAALNYVDGLKGNLLLVHGTGDENVHYQSTEKLINKLIEARKKFFVIPYPNRLHGMLRDDASAKYHVWDTYTWFFCKNLLPDFNKSMNSKSF